MSLPSYPLVPAALGSGYAITLGEVSQASAWALGAGEFPVTFRISGVGWLVFGPRGYIGLMTPELTERYPDMMRVFRSGFGRNIKKACGFSRIIIVRLLSDYL